MQKQLRNHPGKQMLPGNSFLYIRWWLNNRHDNSGFYTAPALIPGQKIFFPEISRIIGNVTVIQDPVTYILHKPALFFERIYDLTKAAMCLTGLVITVDQGIGFIGNSLESHTGKGIVQCGINTFRIIFLFRFYFMIIHTNQHFQHNIASCCS